MSIDVSDDEEEPRQPTMDELRARLAGLNAAGVLPSGKKPRYAGTPGAGPVGMTCHACAHLRYTGLRIPSKHPKCGLTAYTAGDATTIRTSTPACEKFQPVAGERPRRFG